MRDSERFRLRYGPYRTPRFRYGIVVQDEVRGDVRIVTLSDARIPWPRGRRVGSQDTNRGLVVYGALLKALRLESNQAVAYWWGVTGQTVTAWRNALGIKRPTPGEIELRRAHFDEPWGHAARKKALAKARDPVRRAKIATARRGKPRPAHVREALLKANLGKKQTEETRRKRSEAFRRLGIRPPKAGRPWTAREDALLRKLPAKEVAQRTGRTLKAVYFRRWQVGVTSNRGQAPKVGRAATSE